MTQGLPRSYRDPVWLDDLDPSGRETDSDYASLVQDVLHVLSEKLASNLADPTKGADVQGYLNGTTDDLAGLPSIIDTQLGEMTRVSSSKTTLAPETTEALTSRSRSSSRGQL